MLQEKHWNYLVDQLTYLQQMAELNQRLLQVTARQGKLQLIGGYVHGRDSNSHPFIILYSPSKYMDHKICRVYREQFKTLPDFIDTNVPDRAPEDNPTKGAAERQGIYKTCMTFTIATYEGKDTQMGKEIRYMTTVYVGKPPEPKGGMFRAGLIQNRSLQAPAPEWPQEDEILLSDMGAGMTRSHDEPPETQEEYSQRHKEEAAIEDANHEEAIEEALTAQREAAKERVKQLIPDSYPTAEEEGQFIEDTVGDSYDEPVEIQLEEGRILAIAVKDTQPEEATTYLGELNKKKDGVTLSQAQAIQDEHSKLDQEEFDNREKPEPVPDTYEHPQTIEAPEQTAIQKSTTEFIQDHMEHLPPAIRQELLNQQLFPQHDIDPTPELPYKYKDNIILSDSPFVIELYDVYYEVHHKIPSSAEALQLWYVSDGMKEWLAEAHNVEWISQEHDDEVRQDKIKEEKAHEKTK